MNAELKRDDLGHYSESEAEKFERLSRNLDALYIFSPPTHANHGTPLAELIAIEDDTEKTAESYVERRRREAKAAADELLLAKMAVLPAEQREALECYWFKGMTVPVIAAYQGVSEPGVRKRIDLGRKKLREALPAFRTMYPALYFVHSTDEQEIWTEHQARDNRTDVTADTLDVDEWHEEFGYSPARPDKAREVRVNTDGQVGGFADNYVTVDDEREFTRLEGKKPRKRKKAGPSVRDYKPPLLKPKPLTAEQWQACVRAKPPGLALSLPSSQSAYKQAAKTDAALKKRRSLKGVVLVNRVPALTTRHLKLGSKQLDEALLHSERLQRCK